ncbi:PAS domain-containing protein [Dongia sp.]|uniref:PAS domain-containing protein n=1 Tax=Dongia sp. TaxID=1977262 RepID=UPI0035B4A750
MNWISKKPLQAGLLADALTSFRTPSCRSLAEGYLTLLERSGRAIPQKNDLDLANFVTAMPHLALVAITKPDKCIYRIIGQRLRERLGVPKGSNYYDFVPMERRQHAARAMHMVIEQPCAFRAEIRQVYQGGKHIWIEATGFPLRSEEPGVDGFILFADQQIERQTDCHHDGSSLETADLVHRELIDLGFGVDHSFEDMVRASVE